MVVVVVEKAGAGGHCSHRPLSAIPQLIPTNESHFITCLGVAFSIPFRGPACVILCL